MDWTQTLLTAAGLAITIIGTLGGFSMYMFNRLEKRIEASEMKMDHLSESINQTNQRLAKIEGFLSPKNVFEFKQSDTKDEEPKEN